ncbi:MAG: protein translocase subunit SecD [Nitrospiria bacterium]
MKRGIKGRLLTVLTALTISLFFLLPSTPIYSKLPAWWGRIFPDQGVKLGLDLRGGMHLVLEVEVEKAVENVIERTRASLLTALKDGEIGDPSVRIEERKLHLSFAGGNEEAVAGILDENFPNLVTDDKGPGSRVLALREAEEKRVLENATLQALETIRNRVDEFGVSEPLIQKQGANQILVQLPGIRDADRAIDLIGKTALLEFKLLSPNPIIDSDFISPIEAGEEAAFVARYQEKLAEDETILFERIENDETGAVTKRPFLVKEPAVLAGDLLTDARVAFDEFNSPYVSIEFDSVGAKLFEKVTEENVQGRLAIVLDDTVYSAPRIQERISGGRAQISGTFTNQEANDLAIVLRAGALPAPVKVLQNVTVGPSLGSDSIQKGIRAGLLSAFLVVAFMVFYYKMSGLLAVIAMILNIVLLVGALATLNATLTLPGIAGIILSVGMAVDANVLILERIREELRSGRPVRLAIDAGYDKAFSSILDSNVTTLITAFSLIMFGTGPIRGFAVTLGLGITINLFTALVGTKMVYDYLNTRKRMEQLSV